MRTYKGLLVSLMLTPATITWDAVYTLLCLLGISNWSSFHQCPTECMFSLEDGSETEMVPNVSEFLRNSLNIRNDDSALVYCVWRGMISCRWLHYRVHEFLWIFIEHQIMSYGFKFIVKVLLISTYDLRFVDQTMNNSSFCVMWVVGLGSADNDQYE
jgi:hypothetical protein